VPAYFIESSAVVKRYVTEVGTTWVLNLTNPRAGNQLYIARITGAEVISAIARRTRSGSISVSDSMIAFADFRYDFALAYRIIEITPTIINHAMQLAESHALRGYDAVQLAAALDVQSYLSPLMSSGLTLVSADGELNAAAVNEGLTVEDPNTHP
jgi:predicted nucleic acid-binding protein